MHACCAPCSSAIVEWLMAHGVRPTIFYYNPNIWPREEYEIRKQESKRHAESLGIEWIDGDYDHEGWLEGVTRTPSCEGGACYDVATEPERGRRCEQCFTLRLTKTAQKAKELGFGWFTTTLASSRWKSLEQINRAGERAETLVNGEGLMGNGEGVFDERSGRAERRVNFWAQNWRKGGLQERRNQLLKAYGFYNQQYCGCEFSAHSVPTKTVLRQQMRQAKEQHQQQLAPLSADIVERLASHPALAARPALTVMAYWPLKDEVDIRPLIRQLVGQGATVVLPKVTGDETMELRRYTSDADLEEGSYHIMEPVGERFTDDDRIDAVLVPGMAFDAAGHRLGRGKGYYDRLLAASCRTALKIGVCFPFQRVAEVPSEEHDVVMDEVVS